MRYRPFYVTFCAVSLIFAGCDQKKEAATSGSPAPAPTKSDATAAPAPVAPTPAPTPTPTPTPAPVPKPEKLAPAARAAKLGFIKHLPKDSESILACYNGADMAARLKKSKAWSALNEVSEGSLEDAAKEADDSGTDGIGPKTLLGQEVFLATGKGTDSQFGNLMTGSQRLNYFQLRMISAALAKSLKEGKLSTFQPDPDLMQTTFSNFLKDPQSGITLLERMQMPPLWVGFKVADDMREKVLAQVSEFLSMFGSDETIAKPLEFERAHGKFTGFKISGEGVVKSLEEDRKNMEKVLEPALVDRLFLALKTKNLVVASGVVDGYVILFLGSSEEECALVDDVNESLAGNDGMAFADGYATKDVAGICYGSKGVLNVIRSSSDSLGALIGGLRDGIGDAQAAGELAEIQSLLQIVSERGDSMAKMMTASSLGALAFWDQGFHLEFFGGTDNGAVDWDKPLRFGSLGASPDVAMFADWASNADYDKKASAYLESLVETGYAVAMKVASAPDAATGDLAKFSENMKTYDGKLRKDMVSLWGALSGDFRDGLGGEGALVVDLKGGVPPFPGLPQKLVDEGKFIRASLIQPVTDRSKLVASWEKVNAAATSLLKTVSEMSGTEVPMPKPMSSEKDTLKTWYFSMPFMTDDFVPSVTLDDKWFIASTSKMHAQQIAKQADAATDGEKGVVFVMHCDAFREAASQWLKAVDENSAEIFKDKEDALKKFQENKPKAEKLIEAFGELDSVNMRARREDGQLRTSIYIKTR